MFEASLQQCNAGAYTTFEKWGGLSLYRAAGNNLQMGQAQLDVGGESVNILRMRSVRQNFEPLVVR